MKQRLTHLLLLGAVSTMTLVVVPSCNDGKLDDIEKRVTVLEGAWHKAEQDIQNAMVTGATVTNATQTDGVWTLTLSDGKVITIAPSSSGGASVTIEETADAFVITVDGKAYAIPKAASAPVNSLVFVPEFGEDLVEVGNDGATVAFLATPKIDNLDGAEFTVADAREVRTRAGESLFGVNNPTLDGDLLRLELKGLAAERSKNYILAVKMTVKGSSISSNYFRVHVSDDFNFDPEALETPVFIDAVNAAEVGDSYRAQLPDAVADFLGTFNFKDLYKELPAGNVTFELAPADQQNWQVASRYDLFRNCLASDGTWTMNTRPGTSCYDPEKDGIYVYCKVNDQIKNKVFWTVNDPIRTGLASFGRDDDATYGDIHYSPDFPEAQHMEYRTMVPAGANRISFIDLWMKSTPGEENDYLWFQHGDAPRAIEWIQNLSITVNEPGDIVYSDGSKLELGELGQKLARHSRGIWLQSTQPSIVSSSRDNLTEEQKQAVKDAYHTDVNGEIIGGWDGNAFDAAGDLDFGFDEPACCFTTGANYTGTGFRFGVGLRYEYDYGQIRIGGWHTAYIFFNRRLAPEGAVDPSPR